MQSAFHGGAFWDAVGPAFETLGSAGKIISADVLDAWFDPSPQVVEKVREHLTFALRTSPPTASEGLIAAIAAVRGVSARQVMVGGGSSDLIFAVVPRLIDDDEDVLILDPMYGEYAHLFEHVMRVTPHRHVLCEEDNFALDTDRLAVDIERIGPRLVVIVNPNSPTGQAAPGARISRLAEAFPRTTFVVDETYVDFVGVEQSVERDTAQLHNLLVIKSMSKVYALSGARIGYLVGHPDTVEPLRRWVPPWAVSLVGQIAGVAALADPAYYRARYHETHQLRERMVGGLDGLPVTVFPSCCNFFLVRLHRHSAGGLVDRLRNEGIYLRNCNSMSPRFADSHIRIAVKPASVNELVVSALRATLSGPAAG